MTILLDIFLRHRDRHNVSVCSWQVLFLFYVSKLNLTLTTRFITRSNIVKEGSQPILPQHQKQRKVLNIDTWYQCYETFSLRHSH
jgi:hypothetical protein